MMAILEADFDEKNLLPPRKALARPEHKHCSNIPAGPERNDLLRELKTHIRTIEDSDPLFTPAVSACVSDMTH